MAEAAQVLGISAEAVRGRIRRGTLPVERNRGTVYVLLDHPVGDRTTDNQSRTTIDQPSDRTELVEELRDEVRYLRQLLDAEREARTDERRRHDTIMAQLTSRIPQLEPPSSQVPPGSPGAGADEPGGTQPRPNTDDPNAARERLSANEEPQRRSWWREFFGFE